MTAARSPTRGPVARGASGAWAPGVVRVAWPALTVLIAIAALVAALTITGVVADLGAGVQAGRALAQLFVHLAASATIGVLVIAVFASSPGDRRWTRLLDGGAAAAGVWAVAAGAATIGAFLTFGVSASDADVGQRFVFFLSEIELGRTWLAVAAAAAALTVLLIAVRSHTGIALVGVAALAALIPLALQGHAANAAGDHGNAIVAFGLHIVGAAAWLGGLGVLLVLGLRMRGRPLADLAARYSAIALAAFVVVGVSGVVSAVIRIPTPGDLLTPYGLVVVLKTAALVVAGVLGALHRLVLIPRIAADPGRRAFLGVVAGELLVLGLASGFAGGLSASPSPEGLLPVATTPAEILTGSPLPPPFSFATMLTQWRPDVLWVLVCGFLAVLYVVGARRLRRRGDAWPAWRVASWLTGVALLLWLTNGGLNRYQEVLFSAHMLEHMALTMLVPLLLVPAAPVTLALRAIPKRQDGTRGGREWILIAVHSRIGTVLANPLIAAVLFAGSLVVFYYSPVFRWATTDHIGHEWMTVHFLASGYLFVQSLVGADPVPFRFPYPIRLLVLLATMAFHAFFGLTLIVGQGLLLADWYGAMGWGTSALADQQAGGAIAWSVGEIPTLVLAIVVAVGWARSDARESKRLDRRADKTNDADLAAYNEMLSRLRRSEA